MIDLSLIRTDGGTQSRVELDQDTVAEYAEAYRNGAHFPPVTIFFDQTNYWLADGFHRLAGAEAAGQTSIFETVVPGSQRDAILYSLSVNSTHGLKRSNEDKRNSVMKMLNDAEWSTWTQSKIAKHCAVTPEYVSRLKAKEGASIDRSIDSTREVERNGKIYQQNTANIGKTKLAPEKAAGAPMEPQISRATESVPMESDSMDEDFGSSEDYGPSDEEINHAMAAEANQLGLFKALMLSDDPLAKTITDLEMERRMNSVLKSQNNGHMNTINALIEANAKLKRQVKKLGGNV